MLLPDTHTKITKQRNIFLLFYQIEKNVQINGPKLLSFTKLMVVVAVFTVHVTIKMTGSYIVPKTSH